MEGRSLQIVAVVAVVLLMVLGGALEAWLRRLREKRKASAAVKKGLKGEKDAEKLLKKLGYKMLARQAPVTYWVLVDGKPQAVSLSADMVVEYKGEKMLAEVKTGKAVKIEEPATRRQLLEYQLAFGVDTLLLIDMEAKELRKISFPLPSKKKAAATIVAKKRTLRWAVLALLAGVAAWRITQPSPAPNATTQAVEPSSDEAEPH